MSKIYIAVQNHFEFEGVIQQIRDNGWIMLKMTPGKLGSNEPLYILEIDTKPNRTNYANN